MKLDWRKVTTFNLDEYVGLDAAHPQSYHSFMWENLFRHVNIAKKNIHIPDGMTKDIPKYCAKYEKQIRATGGIDLQVLGIGTDGHIGFNEPTSSLASRTRIKTLTPQTRKDNARSSAARRKCHIIASPWASARSWKRGRTCCWPSAKARRVPSRRRGRPDHREQSGFGFANASGNEGLHGHRRSLATEADGLLLLGLRQQAGLAKILNMSEKQRHDVRAVARHFQISGKFVKAAPYGSGHINDTYCVVFNQGGTHVRYIFQRINHSIFKQPVVLMENIQRVTEHLAGKVAGEADASRRVLTLIPEHSGAVFYRDDAGNFWRAYIFIEAARGYDAVENPAQALSAAKAFGQFQNCWLTCRRPA